MKTLIFEGAGWSGADISKATDVGNCRIRTRLRNNVGRVIFLEMECIHYEDKNKAPTWAKGFNYVGYINSVFYWDSKWDRKRNYSKSLNLLTKERFEYNKENILKFVNEKLNCSFDNIEVINEGLCVFDTDEPICDCSDGNYEPYKDIEINISKLEGITPIYAKDGFASYKISYNSLAKLPFMNQHLDPKYQNDCKANIRWDKNGIITDLELYAGVWVGVSAEEVEYVLNLITKMES